MTDVAGPPVPPERLSSLAIREGNDAKDDGCRSGLVIKLNMAAVFEVLSRKLTGRGSTGDTNLRKTPPDRPPLTHLAYPPAARTRIWVQLHPAASSEICAVSWLAISGRSLGLQQTRFPKRCFQSLVNRTCFDKAYCPTIARRFHSAHFKPALLGRPCPSLLPSLGVRPNRTRR